MRAIVMTLVAIGVGIGPVTDAKAQQPAKSCSQNRTKIVGGEAARIEHWPGQAVLRLHADAGKVSQYFCGGTAITDRWVLTAAHCLPEYTSKLTGALRDSKGNSFEGNVEVVLGTDDLTRVTADRVFAVEQVIIHENYRSATRAALAATPSQERMKELDSVAITTGYDIALVRLARPWIGARAGLALTAGDVAAGQQVRVAGFGFTETNRYRVLDRFERADKGGEFFAGSSVLRQTTVETIGQSNCAKRYSNSRISAGQLCAGLEQGGKDSCNGDSGGPLMLADSSGCPAQIGIVSWGDGCAEKQGYGVYTRVSAYADWIQRHTGPLTGASIVSESTTAAMLTAVQVDEALQQLDTTLGPVRGRVRIGVVGGNRIRLGARVVFEAESDLSGRLIILDIDAGRKVTRLYPNQFTPKGELGAIARGQKVRIPGPDYPGFTAFAAQEPAGSGWLIALVVPPDFDVERFAATPGAVSKGFAPVDEPPSYMMRLWRQIETAIASKNRSGTALTGELQRWGYSVVAYEILK